MAGAKTQISNFSHLAVHDEQLARLGALAEHYFPHDPNTCLLKLRQLGELMAQDFAARLGEYSSTEEKQVDLPRRLQARGILYEVKTAMSESGMNITRERFATLQVPVPQLSEQKVSRTHSTGGSPPSTPGRPASMTSRISSSYPPIVP